MEALRARPCEADRDADYYARLSKSLRSGEEWFAFAAADEREFVQEEIEPPVELHLSDCSTLAHDKTTLESDDERCIFAESELHLDPPDITDDDTFRYNTTEWGFNYRRKDAYKDVWEDWDAALIVSKQVKTPRTVADYCAAGVTGKDDIIKGMTLRLGKRKAGEMSQLLQPSLDKEEDSHLIVPYHKKAKSETNYDPDRKKEINEAFPCASWPMKDETQEHTIAKAIAALCFRPMHRVGMAVFKRICTESDVKVIKENLLRSAAKFVMSVFDMEDFLRIGCRSVVNHQYSLFYSRLRDCKCDDPLVAVAEGMVKVDDLTMLREHDICDVIRQYDRPQPYYDNMEVAPWLFCCPDKVNNFCESDLRIVGDERKKCACLKEDKICKSDLRIVGEERKKFVRLKADRKMQLDLEMLRMKGFHVLDNLVLEALAGIDFRQIEKLTAVDKEYLEFGNLSFELRHFRNGLFGEFYGLSTMKSFALKHFLGAVIYPLSRRRQCTSELLEVIKIADHERRMEDRRLINVHHLLYGLSLSRVGDCVKEMLNERGMKPSTLASFGIYKLSLDAANLIGDAKVGLEHLVLAIFFGKQKNSDTRMETSSLFFGDMWNAELLQCLRNSNAKCSVNSLTESHVYNEFLPEDCHDGSNVECDIGVLLRKLEAALDNGFKLLAIREEN